MRSYLHLPCLRGVIGDWTYFCSVMKIKDVVNRVITVSQSNKLYTKNLNDILQREIDEKRVDQIRDYLLHNYEHFFSSIIVAISDGSPIWSDFDIESHFKVDDHILDAESSEFIENKLGVLSLSGEETIFALDGQHRLRGIVEAYDKDPSIGEEEVSLIFVVHNDNRRDRTRRLFTVLNKYAQKPKEAELIILDEDDSAAIITRRLLESHPVLKNKNAIAKSNTSNIPANDNVSFSTLVTINRINKEILKKYKIDYTKRPTDALIEQYYNECVNFWNYFFAEFPEVEKTMNCKEVIFVNRDLYNRNKKTGGSLLLRPVGQTMFACVYTEFRDSNKLDELSQKIKLIDWNLNGYICNHIIWHEKMMPKSQTLQKKLLMYILGVSSDEKIHKEIETMYTTYGIQYVNKFTKL